MGLLVAGGATWLLLLVLVLSICRAAARADSARGNRRLALAAVAAAAAIPAAPAEAAPCPNADVAYEADPRVVRDALVCEIARTRERRDRSRLHGDRRLTRAADRHVEDMVQRSYFSHVSPGGGELRDRLRRAGYVRARCSWRAGEVLAWGLGSRSTARGIVRAWMRSPGHRDVLTSGRYDELGVGLVRGTPERHATGVTAAAVFGARDCSP